MGFSYPKYGEWVKIPWWEITPFPIQNPYIFHGGNWCIFPVYPTTETSLSLMNKARETRERHTDKFHNSMSSLGFEPPNHGVAAIVANHWPRR